MNRCLFGCLAVLALGAPTGASAADGPADFSVGVARASIAPPPGLGIYAGGFGIGAPIGADKVRPDDPIEVRAMVISNGSHAVGFVVADVQAFFPAYQEGSQYGTAAIRAAAAQAISADHPGLKMTASDIIVQGSYTHSGATLEGLWGPVPEAYLTLVHQRAIQALEDAARDARPAHLQAATVAAPEILDTRLNQGGEYQGFAVDDQLAALRAVSSETGATIGTFFNVPVHPDLVNGAAKHLLSDDYLGAARKRLDAVLGGVSIGSPATVGRQEAPVQTTIPEEANWYGQTVANLVAGALADAHWVTSSQLASADSIVHVPGTNAALLALNEAWHGSPDQRQQLADATGIYPVDRSDQPPYLTGNVIGTPQTTLRIGNLLYLSMPGEPFPEIRRTIAADTKGADAVIALSKGQDDLAYFYPAHQYPVTIAWGSDHYEYNVAPQAGDQIIQGAESNIAALGFTTGPGVALPLDNDYQAGLSPAMQLLASPLSGDAGADGTMTTSVQAIFSAAHTNGSPIAGQVHWDFGDGTTADSPALKDGTGHTPAWFDHTFGVGVHTVKATATDQSGRVASATMTITVWPPLAPSIARDGDAWGGSATGGDGNVLAYKWAFSDGDVEYGRVVPHADDPGAVLTVTDGSGSTASTSA